MANRSNVAFTTGLLPVAMVMTGLVVGASGAATHETRPIWERPCVAAKRPVNYGKLMRVPTGAKKLVVEYRGAWRAACTGGGGASLNALLLQAEKIRAVFDPITWEAVKRAKVKPDDEFDVLEKLYKRLMGFMPAFAGVIHNYQFFRAGIDVFARHAHLGDADDRLFFANYRLMVGGKDSNGDSILAMRPWRKHSSTHVSCLRFGTYPWNRSVELFERLQRQLKGAYYLAHVAERRQWLQGELQRLGRKEEGKPGSICTCGAGKAVRADLQKLLPTLRVTSGYKKTATAVRKVIADIRAGRVRVRTRCEDY